MLCSHECQQHPSDTQWSLLPHLGGQMVPPHKRPGSHHSPAFQRSRNVFVPLFFFPIRTHPPSAPPWCLHKASTLPQGDEKPVYSGQARWCNFTALLTLKAWQQVRVARLLVSVATKMARLQAGLACNLRQPVPSALLPARPHFLLVLQPPGDQQTKQMSLLRVWGGEREHFTVKP